MPWRISGAEGRCPICSEPAAFPQPPPHGMDAGGIDPSAGIAAITTPEDCRAFPDADRLTGKSIADYAVKLAGEDKEAYSRSFSALLKSGFKPESYPAEFEKVRAAISGATK